MKQRMREHAWRIAASVSAAIAASATAVAADNSSDALNEVVVTAQFREQRLQDTPLAITAVNAEMLEARGQTSIAQVAAQAPNVSLRPQPQNGGSGLIAFIRGVGQTDFNYALDPGVGVYIDDVYIPTLSSSLLELIDLDRVEILRGPQGTLAGKNSIGGAIKLFSAKPKGDDSGSLRVSYGSFNELNAAWHGRSQDHRHTGVARFRHEPRARWLRRHARLRPDASELERAADQHARPRQFRLPDNGWPEHPGRSRSAALDAERPARDRSLCRLHA